MDDSIDSQKAVDSLFDMTNSQVIAELEDGEKEISYLSSKSGLSEDEILTNLSYLIKARVIIKSIRNHSIFLSADTDRLSELVESDGNFGAAMDGLTKMDSYLN